MQSQVTRTFSVYHGGVSEAAQCESDVCGLLFKAKLALEQVLEQ